MGKDSQIFQDSPPPSVMPAEPPMSDRDPDHVFLLAALERYERPLIRYAMGVLPDLDQARDIVQDVFIKLSRNLRHAGSRAAGSLAFHRLPQPRTGSPAQTSTHDSHGNRSPRPRILTDTRAVRRVGGEGNHVADPPLDRPTSRQATGGGAAEIHLRPQLQGDLRSAQDQRGQRRHPHPPRRRDAARALARRRAGLSPMTANSERPQTPFPHERKIDRLRAQRTAARRTGGARSTNENRSRAAGAGRGDENLLRHAQPRDGRRGIARAHRTAARERDARLHERGTGEEDRAPLLAATARSSCPRRSRRVWPSLWCGTEQDGKHDAPLTASAGSAKEQLSVPVQVSQAKVERKAPTPTAPKPAPAAPGEAACRDRRGAHARVAHGGGGGHEEREAGCQRQGRFMKAGNSTLTVDESVPATPAAPASSAATPVPAAPAAAAAPSHANVCEHEHHGEPWRVPSRMPQAMARSLGGGVVAFEIQRQRGHQGQHRLERAHPSRIWLMRAHSFSRIQ